MLTLIKKKKKKPSVPDREALSTQPLAPPPACYLGGVPRGNQIPRGGTLSQVVPPLPSSLSRAQETVSERGLKPRQFSGCRRA